MSHLTTLVNRYLNAHSSRKDHYVANIIEYIWWWKHKHFITDREVEMLVYLLEGGK